MFRTKVSVDRHVQELFRKVKDENERTLRCYNIAKLYFQVEDYESARRYVSCYLEIKGDQAGPHKLLGKIYEALGQKEPALTQYKQSLELEPRQDDLVLKVCELLADMDIEHDANRVKYWVDRADERFPHHPTVFQLKEKLLTAGRPNNSNGEDLEALIAAELSARPSDVQLRVKLLKYYIDESRLDDAYEHANDVESTHAHRDSVAWYESLCDLLSKCKERRQTKWTYWILYVSSLERYAALSLKEQGHVLKKTIPEAVQAVFNFDQALTEAKLQNFQNNAAFAEQMFAHMWGQLHYHLACLLLRKTKREQGSWSDTGRLCAPLLLAAMHVQPIDTTSMWAINLKDRTKAQLRLWQREASYRCSQSGHVLDNYARDDSKRMMDKIDKFCVGAWRERIYQRIFVSKAHIATSYFANNSAANPPLRLCSVTELKIYDEVAEEVWPASLHHHVWLGIVNDRSVKNRNSTSDENGPRPHQYCHVFPLLQLSIFNLSQAAPDSLAQLDIDAFLNAAVLCASVVVEEQQRSGFLSPDRLPTLPADITNTLCTCTQEKWWSSAYKIYRKYDNISGDIGEIRQELQRGLEVVRCIGNHGLHPAILVHLARIFHHRAKLLKEKDSNHSDLPFVEARCELYWSAVVPLLERLLNNQAIRTTSTKMFDYQGKEMNNVELTNALEEGRLLLTQRYVREKQHEQAIEALLALKCPEASFMQGEIYKSLADELMSTLPKESLTSAMRSQHIVMLSKARGCYYLTLDRLRSPGVNPKHPLNSELGSRIADIENDLKRIDPDVWRGDSNRHEGDVMSEESYSSAHSGDPPVIQNSFMGGLGSTMQTVGTPQKSSIHRTPKQASTPCRIQHQDILELTRKSNQQEARPSPERLDAQIRQLIHSKDNMIQTIIEQNKTLMESNKILVENSKAMSEKIENLQKQFENFCKDSQDNRQTRHNRGRSVSTGQNNIEEDLYILGDEDYADLSYTQQQQQAQQAQIPSNLFAAQQRNPYSPLVYPPAAAAAAYYPGTMPFGDPHGQHMNSLYGGPRVFQMPAYYPRSSVDPGLAGLPKITENMQGMFTNRLMTQFTDIVPQQQQQQQQQIPIQQQQQQIPIQQQQIPIQQQQQIPIQQQQQIPIQQQQIPFQQAIVAPPAISQLSMHLQSFDSTRNELPAKDTPITQSLQARETITSRQAPVNVVITTSDTLPTTAPSVQPPMSVTIPPQYRANSSINQAVTTTTTTTTTSTVMPHSYQISMPSHAMIPTTVNLPPLSTTITNTISATVAEQEKIQQIQGSLLSANIQNYTSENHDLEHDPLPDFVPSIPLPDEIKVTTGEENEIELFCSRAKLYRWSDREWKERGVGSVKLLRNSDGKVRLVMRREQVLKICANHMLTRDMELTRMFNNDRAWIWVANDFADEQVRLEKLCIKFKHPEEAQSFKESFDRARDSSCETRKIEKIDKAKDDGIISSMSATSLGKLENSRKTSLGGFTFSSEPIVQEIVTPEPLRIEEITKSSPFADFTFAKSATSGNENSKQTGGFSFVKTSQPPTTTTTTTSNFPKVSNSSNETKTSLRRPHAPAPANLSASTVTKFGESHEISGELDDNGEATFYTEKINIMRCNAETGQWKNRGQGIARIILEPKTGKSRLYVKRDENDKLFFNNEITASTNFSNLDGTDNVVCLSINVQARGKDENLACLFDSNEQAKIFIQLVDTIKRTLINDKVPVGVLRKDGNIVRMIVPATKYNTEKPLLAEIFKPPIGSWECDSCYMRNNSLAMICIACEAKGPNFIDEKIKKPDPWSNFKPQSDSWECQSCYIRNNGENLYCVACETAKEPLAPNKQKTTGFATKDNSKERIITEFTFGMPKTSVGTLTEMFKPQSGSWECQSCLLRNLENTFYCVACEAPKDPSITVKSKIQGNFDTSKISSPSFSFGVQPITTRDSQSTGFSFKMPNQTDSTTTMMNEDTKNIFGGTKITAPSTNFVFGMPVRPATPPNQESTGGFAFGSPGKSFDFQFSTKSPVKSPSERVFNADASGDDEVAESEDIYFAPVIPLPDRIDVKTGEEDEDIVYSHRAKLFRYDATAKEWKERGLGDLKILRHSITKKLRMIMRRDQTLKLCLNHALTADIELKPKDDKTWLWNAADYSEGDIERLQLACRFKTAEIAAEFKKNLDSAVACTRQAETNETATTLEKMKNDECLNETQTETTTTARDIEVVYEVSVTEEERAEALKLKLPENFYAYRRKNNCSGCRGCREPEIPIFTSEETIIEKKSPIVAKIAPTRFTTSTSGVKIQDTISTSQSIGETIGNTDDNKKYTSFVFGPSLSERTSIFSNLPINTQTIKSPSITSNFGTENLSICSPTSVTANRQTASNSEQQTGSQQQQQQPFGRMQSPFGVPSFTGQTSIFSGTPSTGISIFGGNATAAKNPVIEATKEPDTSIGTSFQSICGGTTKSSMIGANPTFGLGQSTFGTQGFGLTTSGGNSGTTGSTPFGGGKSATHTFGNSTMSGNIFGSGLIGNAESSLSFGNLASTIERSDDESTREKSDIEGKKSPVKLESIKTEPVAFLPLDNGATFSALAAQSPTQPSFKKDPNFSFAGAGATIFGAKASLLASPGDKSKTSATKKSTDEGTNADDEADEDNNEDTSQEHDPHFEPIVPLPDAIEVRTGEEDEEKIFAQRAKLYRYESETKEWKERGTGEMKILYHSAHCSYRFLLRREQVHKVVCNQLITADLELRPLHSSDRAWMWAAFNHAEEPYALEELAVKFKNPELAIQFKEAFEKAKLDILERQASGHERVNETDSTECYTEEQEDEADDDEDDEDDEEHSMIFASRADLLTLQDNTWQPLGVGVLKILYDSEIYGAKIIVEADNTGEILSNTVISMETTMEENHNSCVWTAIDEVLNPPTRRSLKAVFAFPELAQEMYMNFQDGQEYAKQADISEASYYDPRIE